MTQHREPARPSSESSLRRRATQKGASTRPQQKKSGGPLGDLIRGARKRAELGLADVAHACRCSVQFISNIEHGRAPLPWDKAQDLARVLNIPFEQLQAANLSIRSDFKSFMTSNGAAVRRVAQSTFQATFQGVRDTASLLTLVSSIAAQDRGLRDLLSMYANAEPADRKRIVQGARSALQS